MDRMGLFAAETPHRFASRILARQASRDLGTAVTGLQFEEAMARAGFVVHHRNRHGSAHYLAADSSAKRAYEFHKFILVDPIDHPLNEPNRPDPCPPSRPCRLTFKRPCSIGSRQAWSQSAACAPWRHCGSRGDCHGPCDS